jgi:cobalamin biosynthesis protein CbiD
VLSLREHILSCASVSADAHEVRVTRSERLDTVSVAFPAGIDLESRADQQII